MNELLLPAAGEIVLLHTPPPRAMLALVARLALSGPLLALDAGNQFDAFHVARLIRQRTPDLDRVLERVRVARAFTCYQVVALFEQLPPAPLPHVIFDLPATFYDESVPLAESRRLLGVVLEHINRLRPAAPIVISAQPAHAGRSFRAGHRAELLQAITDLADHMFVWETPAAPTPVRLF